MAKVKIIFSWWKFLTIRHILYYYLRATTIFRLARSSSMLVCIPVLMTLCLWTKHMARNIIAFELWIRVMGNLFTSFIVHMHACKLGAHYFISACRACNNVLQQDNFRLNIEFVSTNTALSWHCVSTNILVAAVAATSLMHDPSTACFSVVFGCAVNAFSGDVVPHELCKPLDHWQIWCALLQIVRHS